MTGNYTCLIVKQMKWSDLEQGSKDSKNAASGLLLPNLEILALGVLVVPSTFCCLPSPSCRTSLQAGKVGRNQSGLNFSREDNLEPRMNTGQIGLMLPPKPTAPSGT